MVIASKTRPRGTMGSLVAVGRAFVAATCELRISA